MIPTTKPTLPFLLILLLLHHHFPLTSSSSALIPRARTTTNEIEQPSLHCHDRGAISLPPATSFPSPSLVHTFTSLSDLCYGNALHNCGCRCEALRSPTTNSIYHQLRCYGGIGGPAAVWRHLGSACERCLFMCVCATLTEWVARGSDLNPNAKEFVPRFCVGGKGGKGVGGGGGSGGGGSGAGGNGWGAAGGGGGYNGAADGRVRGDGGVATCGQGQTCQPIVTQQQQQQQQQTGLGDLLWGLGREVVVAGLGICKAGSDGGG